MFKGLPRIVLDTNTLLRGLANPASASGRVLSACESRKLIVLLSRPIMHEYRRVLSAAVDAARHESITGRDVERVLRRLRFVGEYFPRVTVRFEYRRDSTDSKLIELAIAGGATHVVTHDRDLLNLPHSHNEAAKRFRQRLPVAKVVSATEFLEATSWMRD